MKKIFLYFLVLANLTSFAQFDTYFHNKTLRVDYAHAGDATSDRYSILDLIEEGEWAGPVTNLVYPFDYGNYKLTLTDKASGSLIYSMCYSSLFSEWQTTAEARETFRSYNENMLLPFPKNPAVIDFFKRTREGNWEKQFSYNVDPESYFISREKRTDFPVHTLKSSGSPAQCLDVVFIPEGYTADQMDKFKADCNRMANALLNASPYNDYRNSINIYAVLAPSVDEGADIPGKGIWKNTLLNSTFYTFDTERYLTTHDMVRVRDVAANAPYDAICILANSEVYGGGGIYNFYALFTSDNRYTDYVMIHEFGHSFAGLGDEYYTSDVAYEDFYNLKIEPWEPNLTTLVDFSAKWKSMLPEGTPVPTPETSKSIKPGVFEGGGYMAKGIYRPAWDCTMKSLSYDNFCPVCNRAIRDMLDYYTGKLSR